MYQRTIDIIGQQVLDYYNEGFNSLQISKRVKSSKETVKKVLLHFGINYSSDYERKQQEKRDLVIKLYSEGVDQLTLEKDLKMTRKTIRQILDSSIGRRTKSQAQLLGRGSGLNEHAFDNLSDPETAYWIGFLYADGHLNKDQFLVQITLVGSDKEHLEKLRLFLDSSKPVKMKRDNKGREYCKYEIYSEIIYSRFKTLGFDNRKSHTAVPPEELKYSKDFWRGVVDGDGCLHFIKRYNLPEVHLCGTYNTINGFIIFIRKNIFISKKRQPNKVKKSELYTISYYKETISITNLLYKDSLTYLDRKYKIYQEWINN